MEFTGFEVQPTMVIPVRKEWNGFDDVMDDYKSKYRVRARRALKKAEHLNLKELNEKNIRSLNGRMLELYRNVESRSDFYMVSIHPNYFLEMKAALQAVTEVNICFTVNSKQ